MSSLTPKTRLVQNKPCFFMHKPPMLIYFSLLKNVILRKLFFSLPRLS
ncbi:hypothetical protein BS732_3250 [Bacillus subtilis MB73/2]|nr:hypothetical protein BS732_3250 [Bacillus subtilis MB73/2]